MTSLDVELSVEGETVRGDLHPPEGDGPFPVIVMAGRRRQCQGTA